MCKSTRHWLIAIFAIVIILMLIINFLVPYNSIYKDLSNIKVKEVKARVKELEEHPTGDFLVENHQVRSEVCGVIHVGVVCAGHKSNLQLHTLLKSIYFYRLNPIHFHIIANKFSEKVLHALFTTWDVPQVNVTFYDLNELVLDVRWVPNSHYSGIYGLLKLLFPKIVPTSVTSKLLVLDTDLIFTADIAELWKLFNNYQAKQAVGIIENQSDYYLGKTSKKMHWPAIGRGFNSGVLLYHIQKLKDMNWPKLWSTIAKRVAITYGATGLGDQDIINTVLLERPELLYEVPCYWNTQLSDHTLSHKCYDEYRIKLIHWNSPKKIHVSNRDADYFRSWYTSFLEYNGNLLKRQLHFCDSSTRVTTEAPVGVCLEFHRAQTSQWRTLLFFREYQYTSMENDVTFVAQLSFDRLQMVEELVKYWHGPISITLYVTDPELQQANSFIENSELLQARSNIAYHAVFKEGEYYPINILRNVGLRNVNTPYVFLADVDFLPMKGLYSTLKNYLALNKNMKLKSKNIIMAGNIGGARLEVTSSVEWKMALNWKPVLDTYFSEAVCTPLRASQYLWPTAESFSLRFRSELEKKLDKLENKHYIFALIVPAFETQRYRSRIPKNKSQLLDMLEKKSIFPFRFDVWSAGHAPTNYTKWKTAQAPYNVKWEPDFEPYIVVRSDVSEYDNRFMGFGWNKVSHIMELEAQGYEFIVLPNAFIIHKAHAPSYDIAKFRTSPIYRMCLQNLKEEFVQNLNKNYGRVFDNKNVTLGLFSQK